MMPARMADGRRLTANGAIRWFLPPVFVLALVASPAPVFAKAQPARKVEDVVRVLKVHSDPVAADFATVGSDVDVVLGELIGGAKVDTTIRARAALALGRFPAERWRSLLSATVASADAPVEVRAAAMIAYARIRKEGAFDDLKPWLTNPDVRLRIGAARALGEAGGARARALLMDTIEAEDSLDVRAAMEQALKKL